jgi:hypothetical protein
MKRDTPFTLLQPMGKVMQYLIREKGQKTAAHIWTGIDTSCTMYSTGGLTSSKGYRLSDSNEGRKVCTMCVNNLKKAIVNPYQPT